jgi:ribose/xylose/arabinose/galactoside ABC-type transport system permease subunit
VTATETRPPAVEDSSSERLRRWLYRPETPAIIFLVAMLLVFAVVIDGFARPTNLHSILLQVSVVAIIAFGVNQVILGGEIDISMGSLLGLAAVGAGTVAVSTGSFWLALATGVAVGTLVGALTGFIVTKGRVPAIIVTLGMLYALRGANLLITGGRSVSGIPMETRSLGRGELLGIGAPVWLMLAVMVLAWFLSQHTTWGRNVIAIGGNRRAARMAGLAADRARLLTFVFNGALVGLAAVVYIGRTAGVQPNAGAGLELQAIAAVVLGGTSIAGGRGSAFSPFIGALIIGVITNAMILQRVPSVWQSAVLGALILIAVAVDGVRGRLLKGGS